MILFGLMQLFLILAVTYYEYKNKSPIVFMWATLLVMFGIMHVVSFLLTDYQYSNVLDEASFFVILFCLIYLPVRVVSRRLIRKKEYATNDIFLTEKKLLLLGKIVLLFSVLIYAYFVIRTSGSLLLVTKENVYKTMAKGSILFLLSTYLYYASAPLFLYCLLKRKKTDALIIALLIVFRSLLSSARMDMVILFVGAISYIILNSKGKRVKNIIALGVVGILALVAIYALRTFRYYYSFTNLSSINIYEFIGHMIDFVKNDDGELGLRSVFYYFIQNDNEFAGFGTGDGYKRVLMLMIPSRLTGGLKPEDMCVVMGRAWKPEVSGIITYTVTPTLFGDCYANFGFWGFLMGGVWALIGTLADWITYRKNEIISLMLWGLIGIEFIDIGRGSVYNPLCHVWYCGIILIGLYFLRRIRLSYKIKIIIGRKVTK